MHRLITITFSHYNEKARWALDRFEVPYIEEPYMPLFHMGAVAKATWRIRAGTADKVSSRFSTPVLITDDGQTLCDSQAIVAYVSQRYADSDSQLYPSPDVQALETRLHDKLGPHSRRLVYYFGLADKDIMLRLAENNVSRRQSRLFRALFPAVQSTVRKRLRITPDGVDRSMAVVRREMAYIEQVLGERRYLVGDRFTAADLAFACMAAAVVIPSVDEGYGAVLPALSELRPDARAWVDEFRATRAGRFALRLFREERGRRVIRVR